MDVGRHPFSFKNHLCLARLVFQFVLGRLTKLLRLSNATRHVKAPTPPRACVSACVGSTSVAVIRWARNKLQRSQLVTLRNRIKYKTITQKGERMRGGSLLSSVLSSATCELGRSAAATNPTEPFTAVQTNSKSTVLVFKSDFLLADGVFSK